MALSPQKFRAAFCSLLYDKTGNIELVKEAAGHAAIATTQRYINSKFIDSTKALEKLESLINESQKTGNNNMQEVESYSTYENDNSQDISDMLKELTRSVEYTNQLLIKVLEKLEGATDVRNKTILDSVELGERVVVVGEDKFACFEWANKRADELGIKIEIIDRIDITNVYVAKLMSHTDGDLIVVNAEYVDEESLLSVVLASYIDVRMGQGSQSRIVRQPLPKCKYVIYSQSEDSIPSLLLKKAKVIYI